MKKIGIWLCFVLLVCAACGAKEETEEAENAVSKAKEEARNEENNDMKERVKPFEYVPAKGYEKAAFMVEKIQDDVMMAAVGWSEENGGESYIEFFTYDNGEWTSDGADVIANSVQFEPKTVEVIEIDEEVRLAVVVTKDVSRGFVGAVSVYEIKGDAVRLVDEMQENRSLKEDVQMATSDQVAYLKDYESLDDTVVERGAFVSWHDEIAFIGYDKEKEETVIQRIENRKTMADLRFGENKYVVIYLDTNGEGFEDVAIPTLKEEVLVEIEGETIIIEKGANIVIGDTDEPLSVHSDIDNPGALSNAGGITYHTLLKEPFIENIQPGTYTFFTEHGETGESGYFEIVVQ